MGATHYLFAEAVFLGEWVLIESPKRFSTRRSISHVVIPSLYVEKATSQSHGRQ
jgi:hypothetical protein